MPAQGVHEGALGIHALLRDIDACLYGRALCIDGTLQQAPRRIRIGLVLLLRLLRLLLLLALGFLGLFGRSRRSRSEEHTSELQSQSNLVCRLLLEKKKKNMIAEDQPSELQSQSNLVCLLLLEKKNHTMYRHCQLAHRCHKYIAPYVTDRPDTFSSVVR